MEGNDTQNVVDVADNTNSNVSNTQTDNADNSKVDNDTEKKFTQAELNRLIKAEKEKSKASVLRELGVDDFKTAKEGLAEYLKIMEANKTDLQKMQEALSKAESIQNELKAENTKLSVQASAMKYGANPDSIDTLSEFVVSKLNDETTVDDVMKSLKENPAFSGFFATVNDTPKVVGTGSAFPPKTVLSGNDTESYGARLAKARMGKGN